MTDQTFAPEDFVYVDPEARKAVSLVEWDKDGNAIPKEWPYVSKHQEEDDEPQKGKRPRKKRRVRYYPWGSYKTMSKLYKLEGKVRDKEVESYIQLEDAIDKLQEEPYWDS